MTDPSAPVVIASGAIRVTVEPSVGGTIAEVMHLGTGLSVLGQVPWDRVRLPIGSFAARDEVHWLTRYDVVANTHQGSQRCFIDSTLSKLV